MKIKKAHRISVNDARESAKRLEEIIKTKIARAKSESPAMEDKLFGNKTLK